LLYHSKSIGIFAEEAENPAEASRILEKAARNGDPFKYVLLDEQFFNNDGLSLFEYIKSSSLLKHTSIALMLGKNDLTAIEKAKINGINNVIYKPIQQTVFQNNLKKMLGTFDETDEVIPKQNLIPKNKTPQKPEEKAVILVAEDNLINQKVILSQISVLGYEVDIVPNGKEVLEALKLRKYDLILMDCQMPLMDGLETTVKIRESNDEYLRELPVIAITAQTISEDKEKCLAAGMNDYIIKPTNQQELKEILNFWLNKSDAKEVSANLTFQSNKNGNRKNSSSEAEKISKRLFEISKYSDNEVVIECIGLFLEDSAEVLSKIEKACENSNYERILRETHKLKGSAANMGAEKLPELCQKLITEIREDNFESVAELFNEISTEYDLLKPVYKKEFQNFQNKQNTLQLVG
ncbi:MAG: response regulator, partial [Aridibacter sp.]